MQILKFIALCAASSLAFSADMNAEQKESYSVGFSTGSFVINKLSKQAQLGVKFDANAVIDGFIDAIKKEQKFTDEEIISLLNAREEKIGKIAEQRSKIEFERNLKDGKEFMAKNAKNKKVKTTKSGLQYEILALGEGEKPKLESIVKVKYKAYLPNGKVFEDTAQSKTPAYLSMINIIDGLQEGLMMMNTNSKYKFVIPSNLGYGDETMDDIPAGSTLVFEVELLKVLKPSELAGAAKELSQSEGQNFHGAHSHGMSVMR